MAKQQPAPTAPQSIIPSSDVSDLIERPPVFIVYGEPDLGKSFDVCLSFAGKVGKPGALFILTQGAVIRSYASWCENNRAAVEQLGLRTPLTPNPRWTPDNGERAYLPQTRPYEQGGMKIIVLPKFRPYKADVNDPSLALMENALFLNSILVQYVLEKTTGVVDYSGIVIDEGTEIIMRVQAEFEFASDAPGKAGVNLSKAMLKKYDDNPFAKSVAINDFTNTIVNLPDTAGGFLGLVCHENPVKYHDGKTPGYAQGLVKYKGGPKLGTGPIAAALTHAATVVLRKIKVPNPSGNPLDAPIARWIRRSPDINWWTKWRGENAASSFDEPLVVALRRDGFAV